MTKTASLERIELHTHKSDGSHHHFKADIESKEKKKLSNSFSLSIAPKEIAAIIDDKILDAGQKANIQGFRPGKVPASVLKKKFGKEMLNDSLKEILDHTISKVISKYKLRIATDPKIDVKKYSEEDGLVCDIAFELLPEFDMPDFKKLSLEKHVFDLKETDLKEAYDRLLDSQAEMVPAGKKAKAKNTDTVVMDFVGKIGKEAFEGGTANDFKLVLGSKSFIDNFEDQLVGLTSGDKKEVKVTFPKEYHAKNLAGKKAVFSVEIKEILESKKPKLDDEFAKKVGLKSVAELKEKIKEQITKDYEQVLKTHTKKKLFDQLEKLCKFDAPEGMIENEYNTLWAKAEEIKKSNPDFSDKSDSDLKKEYKSMSKRRVQLGILLAELGKIRNVEISQDELRAAVMDQARMYQGQESAIFDYYKKNPAAIDQLRGPIMEDKVVDYILSEAKFKDKKVTLEQIKKLAEDPEYDL